MAWQKWDILDHVLIFGSKLFQFLALEQKLSNLVCWQIHRFEKATVEHRKSEGTVSACPRTYRMDSLQLAFGRVWISLHFLWFYVCVQSVLSASFSTWSQAPYANRLFESIFYLLLSHNFAGHSQAGRLGSCFVSDLTDTGTELSGGS